MSDYQELLAELPSDWSTLPIEEIGEVISGGTPSRSNPRYWGGEIPWVTPGEVTSVGKKHLEETDEKITAEGLAKSGAMLLPSNSLLITTRASLGAAVLNMAPVTTNQGFKSIAFTRHFSPDYYFHWSTKLKAELVRLASGTTFLEISGTEFRKISLPVPPYAEQRLIARILDTLDIQIEKTEALIAKLEKVKEGLLHDLLTRGIDENGQLRPSPEQAPELYKESPLGLIPKEWEAQELCALGVFNNGLNKPKEAFGSGTRFINISDVYPDYLVPDTLARVQVTRTELETYSAEFGDIFIDRSSVKLEGVGYPTVFEGADEPVVYSGFIIRFRLNEKSRTLPRFLCCQMRSEAFRSEVFKVATKSANVNINQVALSTLIAVIPSTEEQHKIVLREWTLDTRLQVEREKKERLHRIKAGLMDDLLAGRIRVTPLLKQA